MKKAKFIVYSFVKKVLIAVEALLLLTVVLRFLDANEETFIVKVLYKASDIVVWPFQRIFPNHILSDGTFLDIVGITSMVGYGLIILILYLVMKAQSKEE